MTTIRAGRLAAVFAVALSLHILPTAIATAEPIRVLLVMPRETGELSRAVARIEDAMKGPDGPVAAAQSLADADAVVQFIRYQRKVGEKNEPQEWWLGQFKLLTAPRSRAAVLFPTPERFGLALMGQDNVDALHVVGALARILSKALGHEERPPRVETT